MYVILYIHMNGYNLLGKEKVVLIRELQKHPSRSLQGVTRIMRGGKSLGVFFPDAIVEELMEDLEAVRSTRLKKRAKAVRTIFKEGKKARFASAYSVAKRYGV